MNQETIFRVVSLYGYTAARVGTRQKGYRNQSYPITLDNGRMVNFILYKDEPGILDRIKNANYVANYVAATDMPVRRTINPKILQLQAGDSRRYGALYNYLPGSTIPWEAYTMEHLKLLGATLSAMHARVKIMPRPEELADITDDYLAIVGRMQRYFDTPTVSKAIVTKLGIHLKPSVFATLTALLRHCAHLPGKQALHMDFVRSNVLFLESAEKIVISGILDFEKTAWGHPMFDIARTLAFLLVDCKYKSEDKVRKYFLASGYNKRGEAQIANTTIKTTDSDFDLLEALLNLFLIYDFYKFLRHNPYETLEQNEHFVRTRDLLATRAIIDFEDRHRQ